VKTPLEKIDFLTDKLLAYGPSKKNVAKEAKAKKKARKKRSRKNKSA
jgi:hypothetical protein